MRTYKYIAAAAVAAAVLAPSAAAGNGPHRMAADYGKPLIAYELKVDGAPQSGQPLVVSLIDRRSGQPVAGEVAVMRPVYLGIKAYPAVQWMPMALKQKGDGTFVCPGTHHTPGERVVLRGEGPSGAPVWLTLRVQG